MTKEEEKDTLSEAYESTKAPTEQPQRNLNMFSRWAQYILGGALVGAVVAHAATFGACIYDGYINRGMDLPHCTAYATAVTVLTSHPAGVSGMIAGGTTGLCFYAMTKHREKKFGFTNHTHERGELEKIIQKNN